MYHRLPSALLRRALSALHALPALYGLGGIGKPVQLGRLREMPALWGLCGMPKSSCSPFSAALKPCARTLLAVCVCCCALYATEQTVQQCHAATPAAAPKATPPAADAPVNPMSAGGDMGTPAASISNAVTTPPLPVQPATAPDAATPPNAAPDATATPALHAPLPPSTAGSLVEQIRVPANAYLKEQHAVIIAKTTAWFKVLQRSAHNSPTAARLAAHELSKRTALMAASLQPAVRVSLPPVQDGSDALEGQKTPHEVTATAEIQQSTAAQDKAVRAALQCPERLHLQTYVLKELGALTLQGKSLAHSIAGYVAANDVQSAQREGERAAAVAQRISALWTLQELMPRLCHVWQKPADTAAHLRRAVAKDAGSPLLWCALGETALQRDMPHEALQHIEKSLDIDHSYPLARAAQSLAHLRLGQTALAESDISTALQSQPDFAPWLRIRGAIRMMLGKHDAMCEDFANACAQGDCQGLGEARKRNLCLPKAAGVNETLPQNDAPAAQPSTQTQHAGQTYVDGQPQTSDQAHATGTTAATTAGITADTTAGTTRDAAPQTLLQQNRYPRNTLHAAPANAPAAVGTAAATDTKQQTQPKGKEGSPKPPPRDNARSPKKSKADGKKDPKGIARAAVITQKILSNGSRVSHSTPRNDTCPPKYNDVYATEPLPPAEGIYGQPSSPAPAASVPPAEARP